MNNKFILLLCLCAFAIVFCLYGIVFSRDQAKNVLKSKLLHNSHFYQQPLLDPWKVCGAEEYRRAVLVVTSYVGHVRLRSAHRRAMPVQYLDKLNATRVFLLAQIPPDEKPCLLPDQTKPDQEYMRAVKQDGATF